MGYQHRIYETRCGNCGTVWLLSATEWRKQSMLPWKFKCKSCGSVNVTKNPRLYQCSKSLVLRA
jgi:uncharacterized OB-fold protein